MARKKPAAAPALQDRIKELRRVPGRELIANPLNYRTHPEAQRSALAGILEKVGIAAALIGRDTPEGLVLIDGHLRAEDYGDQLWPVLVLDVTEEEGNLLLATLDPLAAMAGQSSDLLAQLMGGLDDNLAALAALTTPTIIDEPDAAAKKSQATGVLRERFVLPPFSVLDARQGYWQDRKRAWKEIGIRGEIGRGGNLMGHSDLTLLPIQHAGPSRAYHINGCVEETGAQNAVDGGGTSIFDPVLAELAYRWFSPPGGSVLDPFAGGCSRGAVASFLGRHYTGVDLSEPQVQANEAIADEMGLEPRPRWINGDAADVATLAPGVYDMLLTCPPYADLEVYSDDPRDLSAMDYPAFVDALGRIIAGAVGLLRDDSFAVIVVGEVRGPSGNYRGLVADTIAAFENAGARYYNEAILVTSIGSLSLRTSNQFKVSRKVGKTHQNVLVFVKGDARRAAERCGEVEVGDPTDAFGELLQASKG